MTLPASFTSGWDPLWKGLGLEAAEEVPAPASFGSEAENSLKKRVSFVLSKDQEDEEKKKKNGWSWRRKQRKRTARKRRQGTKRKEDNTFLDEYSGDSFDSFEAREIEHRDEDMDGDLWEGSDSRDPESDHREDGDAQEDQGLWSTFFAFGDDERDFDDGWTEGDSSIFSEQTGTSLDSSFSEEVQTESNSIVSLNSDGEEGEEVELLNLSSENGPNNAESIRAEGNIASDSIPTKEQRDEASPSVGSCLGAGRVDCDQGDAFFAGSRTCIPAKLGQANPDKAAGLDKQPPQVVRTTDQQARDQNATTEARDKTDKHSEEKKKKKTRWKVGRGKGKKPRSQRKNVGKSSPHSVVPVSEEKREEFTPPRKIAYGVDTGDSGTAHKSCMPVLFGEGHQRRREPIGKLLCRSQKTSYSLPKSAASVTSDLTSQATTQASTPVPLVRIVSDAQGNQGPVVGKATDHQSDIHQQMQLQGSHFATAQGPQSIYTYEYDSGTAMDVSYKHFGADPEAVLDVREYNFPMTIFPGTNEVIVMVEVRTLS